MSEQKDKVEENPKKVVITPDDAKAAFEFWNQYEVPVMPGLKEAFDKFCGDPTYENQEHLKYMVTKAVSTTDHEAFKDETFSKITEQCGETAYDMGFERDFVEVVGEE